MKTTLYANRIHVPVCSCVCIVEESVCPTVGHVDTRDWCQDVLLSGFSPLSFSETGSVHEPGVHCFDKAGCPVSPPDTLAHTPSYAPFPPRWTFDPAGYRASLMFFRVDPYLFVCWFVWDRISIYSPDWHRTRHCRSTGWPRTQELPSSASQELRFNVYSSKFWFYDYQC